MNNRTNTSFFKKELINPNYDSGYAILSFMLFIYPFIVIPNLIGYFYLPRYIVLAILSVFALPLLYKNKSKLFHKPLIPLLFSLVFAIISAIKSINPETAWIGLYGIKVINNIIILTARFTGLSTYIFCIIMFLLAYQSDKNEKLIKYMVIAAALVSAIAVLQHFKINFIPHDSLKTDDIPYSTIGQHNFLATYTVFILPAAMFYYLKYKDKLYLLCSSMIYAGLIVSRTRGAWIAFAFTYIIFVLYIIKNKNLKKDFIIVSTALILVTCILLPSQGGVLLGRVASIPSNISSGLQLDDSAGSARLYIWKKVVNLLPKYWAFGIGPDNLIYAGIPIGTTIFDKAHNIYLEMAVTMGIFALVSYLTFLSYFLRPWKNEDGFMYFVMILTYLIQGFFNIDVIMVMPIFWIVLGFSLRNSIMHKSAARASIQNTI